MTARKPKPVRAWAIYSRGGVIPRHALTTSCLCVSPKRGKFLVGPGERVIRVTIVQDDTPSADAEVRRLRKIVRAMVKWHRDVNFPTNCVCVWCEEFGPKKKRAALRGRRGR